MATFNGIEVAAQEAGFSGTSVRSSADIYGRVRRSYFSFVTPAGMAINDTVRLARLPKGARVHHVGVVFGAMGTGATVSIGLSTTGDASRYVSGLSVASAGFKLLDLVLDRLPDSIPAADEPTYLIATVTGAAWASGIKLQGYVEYVVE